jgi:hypothetical protein
MNEEGDDRPVLPCGFRDGRGWRQMRHDLPVDLRRAALCDASVVGFLALHHAHGQLRKPDAFRCEAGCRPQTFLRRRIV